MSNGPQLEINGKLQSFPLLTTGACLTDVVRELALTPDRIAVEVNGEIVRRSEWAATLLKDRDRLEIVHFVGGGRAAL